MSLVRASMFVGRKRQLEELLGALEDAEAGRGRLLLLSGEPGIGKSRLADELAARAKTRGTQVSWGRCWEAGGAPAYWPWLQSIRSLVRELDPATLKALLGAGASDVAQMLPELRQILPEVGERPGQDADTARFRLFDATSAFLRRMAERDPLLLILDDLHAADTPSLLMLQFLAGELDDSRILVLGVYRDTELFREHPLAQALTELLRRGRTRQIALRGLSSQEVEEFVVLVTEQGVPTRRVGDIHAATEGNPLFVTELVRLLVAEGRLGPDSRGVPLDVRIPHELKAVIARRLERLSEETHRALTLASVLGREFEVDTLARVSGLSGEELVGHLEEAGTARVIVDVPGSLGRLRFSHALVRDSLYDELQTVRRTLLHREVGDALEEVHAGDLDPRLAELAHHFVLAAPAGAAGKGVTYARRAAERAVALLAYEEAVRLYEMGLQALDFVRTTDQAARCGLLLGLGDAQTRAGDFSTAKQTFLHAAEFARKHEMAEALARAALGYGGRFIWEAGRDDPRVRSLLEEALAALGDEPSDLKVMVMARFAAGPLRDDPERGRRDTLSHQAVEMARGLPESQTLAYALVCRNAAMLAPDNLDERLRTADELVRLAQRIGDSEREHQGRIWRTFARWELGDMPGVYEDIHAQERLEIDLRQPAQRWLGLTSRAVLAGFEGHFDAADALASAAAEVGRGAAGPMVAVYDIEHRWTLGRERGRLEEIVEELRTLARQFPMYPVLRCELAHAYAELGRRREARGEFEALSEDGFSSIPRTDVWIFSLCLLTEVTAWLGDEERGAVLYDLLLPFERRLAAFPVEGCLGSVARPLGSLAAALGRFDESVSHLEAALDANVRAGGRPWVAHTQFELAQTLIGRGGSGDVARAAELLSEAASICTELRMTSLQGRIAVLQTGPHAASLGQAPVGASTAASEDMAVFRREGEYWHIGFLGDSFRLRDRKGLRYISRLLSEPDRELHVLDLAGGVYDRLSAGSGRVSDVLDPQAKAAYRLRLDDLEDEIEEARTFGDHERAARAEEERAFIAAELAASMGLGGRQRRTGSAEERARVAVTQAIRTALAKIRGESSVLGDHLERTISTGAYCRYAPDPRSPIEWQL